MTALGCQSPQARSQSENSHLDSHPSVPFCRIWTLDNPSVCPIFLLQHLVSSPSAQTPATLSSDLFFTWMGLWSFPYALLVLGHTTYSVFLLLIFPACVMVVQISLPYNGVRNIILGPSGKSVVALVGRASSPMRWHVRKKSCGGLSAGGTEAA